MFSAAWLDCFLSFEQFERESAQFFECGGLFACVVVLTTHDGLIWDWVEPLVYGPVECEVSLEWLILAMTSMLLRDRFFLNAIIGGLGNLLWSLSMLCSSLQLSFNEYQVFCH